MVDADNWIEADWPAPAGIHAGTTLRHGGSSQLPYHSFNLATHVGDDAQYVIANRTRLVEMLGLAQQPVWLNQQHSTQVIKADQTYKQAIADASYTKKNNVVCAVLTADCLPILLCDEAGDQIAAIHAGWRGLLNGIIENTVSTFNNKHLMAWLGPAISQQAFEVGEEVRSAFINHKESAELAFIGNGVGKWRADLYQLAMQRLNSIGVSSIYGGGQCTYSEQDRFYSYRRTPQTGRIATLIWKN